MDASNIFLSEINEIASKNPLVSAIYGRTSKSFEKILEDNGIDVIK